jgi:tetratricopeptide (TPR) repeat protein
MKKAFVLFLGACLIGTFTFAAGSSSNSSSSSDRYGASSAETNRFSKINALIRLEKFAEAHKMLKSLKKLNTDEADRLNLLGFTARKSGDLAAAGDYYQQALALNPKHTGALEYQGELFIQLGKIELAKANLAKIDKICWLPCNAERDLKKAIEKSITN